MTSNPMTSTRMTSTPVARLDAPARPALLERGIVAGLGLVALAVILAALVLQHGFGYAPCPLCLLQRWPYYVGVPLALGLALAWPGLGRPGRGLGVLALGLVFGSGLWLGVYHAGAEWQVWRGPADCSGSSAATGGSLLQAIQHTSVVSCTDPALRVLGLSLAGWNAVVMAGLLVALTGVGLRLARTR